MKCPNCQSKNPNEAKFCMNCGNSLATAVQGASGETNHVQAKNQSLDKFIPRELMTKFEAARAQDAMVGERRVITMLFCDVKGSTAAAEKVDPETWTDIMNGIFEFMIRPVYKYEGTVPRLMGDAILAFFGAPIAHEDDPQRAVLAGLEIQEGIKEYAEEVRIKHGLEFGLRVGINTGLVVVGAIGSDLRMEYTAIGDAINLAARMEQTAVPGTVQISDETYKLVAPFFEFEALGEVEVKGKAAPIKTYRPLGVKKRPGHLRGLVGLSSPLVGRETQLTLLNQQLKQLKIGAGSIVSVVGEAGLGKSTLIAELKKSNDGFTWLRGDALSYARSVSYFPWRQIIRQSIDAYEGDSPGEVRRKLNYVCGCCALPGGDLPLLEAMLSVESEESLQALIGVQGEALIQKMVSSVCGYLCGLAKEGPHVIVFDDLHWADEASLNLLLNLADLTETQPILFICMLRPDKTAASWDAMHKIQKKVVARYHSILLEPLHVEQTEMLLINLLGVKDLPKNVRDMIVERADGNPFFIEELIRSLIETKQIIRKNSHWRAMNEDAKVSLPDTLRGVLGARIDRLPELTKHVLQNASVIGRSFDLRVLKQLTSMNGSFDSQIQYLQEASLIEPFREEYAFRHVLIQEAAYDSILIKKRAELHRRIGETLEELHENRIDEFAPLIANHFYFAQDGRSLKYDLLAGEKAARLYANIEAATHFSRALEVAKRTKVESEQIIDLYTQLGSVLELSGRFETALATYEEMQIFGHEHADRRTEMKALMAKATIYSIFSQLHNSALSEQMLVAALDISREIGDRATQAKLNWNLMITYLFSKRLEQSLQHGQAALTLARDSSDREQLAFVLNDLCRLYTCRGEFEKAHASIREARELWKSLDHQVMLADSFGSEAETYFNAGKYGLSLDCSQQALKISVEINNLWGQAYDRMLMAFSYFENGQLGRGIQLAEQSCQLADEAGLIASSISLRAELAWVYAYCGAVEKGLPLIEQASQIADAKQPAWSSFPQAAKVRMRLLMNDVQSAEQIIGNQLLQPTSIPYARYTIFVCLANIELAMTKKEFDKALSLADELLDEVIPLTRVDVPEVLRWKGNALLGLGRSEEALQTLTQACSLAKQTDSNLHLWVILRDLAQIQLELGNQNEPEDSLAEGRKIARQVAESLLEVGLSESFLNQPRVKELMR
ncbi:MAG: AAA family ATPase [Chloroflexi bacterium]|nr:AAA family ATPase [Chloroflexota bacterium]